MRVRRRDLLVAADTAFRLGDWDAADTAALEAIRVAGEVGQPAIVGWVLTIRVRILAAQGRHAAGARRRREPDNTALTAQELRVAAAVQRGASNRDIAADLF